MTQKAYFREFYNLWTPITLTTYNSTFQISDKVGMLWLILESDTPELFGGVSEGQTNVTSMVVITYRTRRQETVNISIEFTVTQRLNSHM